MTCEANLNPANAGGTRRTAEPFTDDELIRLLAACAKGARPRAMGIRNQAAMVLWWRGGIRVAESVDLRPVDINLTTGDVTIMEGKGSKRRVVRIDPGALPYLRAWNDIRPDADTWLTARDGGPWSTDGARAVMHRAARRADIHHAVRPHGLRHRYAVELVRENVSMPYIRQLLGHSSLATTAHYLSTLHPEEALSAISSRSFPSP